MLSDAELRVLRALAEALIPPGGPFPLGAGDVGTAERLARYLQRMAPETQGQVRLLLRAWEAAPLASRHLRRFSRLAPAARDAWVERCLASRLPWRRIPLLLLKTLCLSAFCADPRVEAALGYGHDCLDGRAPGAGPRLVPLQYPDVCVVGSGAGGAVVAYELARAGLRVVVLEEGGYFTQADFTGPPMERVQRFYRNGGATVALGRPTIPVPLGKCVGGTTVVNSGTCFRTPARVLGAWASEHGVTDADPATMAPYFDEVEHMIGVRPVPWEIIGRNAEVFDRGVRALGLGGEPIRRNIVGCRGCGECAFGCPSDAKQAMHLTYLPAACAAGARLYARCRVERMRIERGGAPRARRQRRPRPAPRARAAGRGRRRRDPHPGAPRPQRRAPSRPRPQPPPPPRRRRRRLLQGGAPCLARDAPVLPRRPAPGLARHHDRGDEPGAGGERRGAAGRRHGAQGRPRALPPCGLRRALRVRHRERARAALPRRARAARDLPADPGGRARALRGDRAGGRDLLCRG